MQKGIEEGLLFILMKQKIKSKKIAKFILPIYTAGWSLLILASRNITPVGLFFFFHLATPIHFPKSYGCT